MNFDTIKSPSDFKTKKDLTEYTRNLLKHIGICSSIKNKNIDAYNYFIKLFESHPKNPEKTKGIVDLKITQNKVNRSAIEINMVKENSVEEDISWVACIKGKTRDPLPIAYRVAIDDQIKEFRKDKPSKCVNCGETKGEMHVDHIIHFEKLILDFEKLIIAPEKDSKLQIPKLFANHSSNMKCFRDTDKEFEKKWKDFHKKNATLRILCKKCNTTRENYKEPELTEAQNETPPNNNVMRTFVYNGVEYIDDLVYIC